VAASCASAGVREVPKARKEEVICPGWQGRRNAPRKESNTEHYEYRMCLVLLSEKCKHSRQQGGVLGQPNGERTTNCPNTNRAGGWYSYFSPFMMPMVCFPDPLVLPPDSAQSSPSYQSLLRTVICLPTQAVSVKVLRALACVPR